MTGPFSHSWSLLKELSAEDYEMASRTGGIPSKREIMPGQFQHIAGPTHGGVDTQGQHQTLTEGMARQLAMAQRGDIGRTDEHLFSESGRSKPWPSPYAGQMTNAPEELGNHPPIRDSRKRQRIATWNPNRETYGRMGGYDFSTKETGGLHQGMAQRGPRIQEEPKTKPEDFTMEDPMNQAMDSLREIDELKDDEYNLHDEEPKNPFKESSARLRQREEDKMHLAEQEKARVAQVRDRPLHSEMERRERKRKPFRGSEAKTARMKQRVEENIRRKEKPVEKAWNFLKQ